MSDRDQKSPPPHRFRAILNYLRRYRRYLWLGALCIVLSNSLMLVIPYLTKVVFDHLEAGGPHDERLMLVGLMVLLAILSGAFRFLTRRTVIWMSRWIEYDLRADLFAHLLGLSPSYFDRTRTGDIMVRLTSDIEAVRMMVGPGIMHVCNTIITMVVATTVMVYLSPMMTLIALGPMLLIPLAVNRLGNIIHERARAIQEHFSELTATVQENIAGVRVVKAFRQETPEIGHFRDMSQTYFGLNMKMAQVNAMLAPFLMTAASLLVLAILYYGGRGVIRGAIPLGTLVAFFGYMSMLFWPAIALGWVVSLYQRGTASLDRINRIMRTDLHETLFVGAGRTDDVAGRIEFRKLTFGYDDRPVLKDIELTVEPGQTIGIIGKTGCGKSTLVSLLAQLYPVARGQLFIDGVDINDWDITALRRRIGFAPQEPFLFSDSIDRNMKFGRTDASEDEVAKAARIAVVDGDIAEFPDGFATMVGERGITLSGGQKQRTAVARAILREPSILVLDDVTSAVDTETEAVINERIKQVLTGRTSIIISHRVSAVKEADQIILLDDGAIAERGGHDDLIKQGGHYAELYRSQLIEQELEQL